MTIINKLYGKMTSDGRFFPENPGLDYWIELHEDPETGDGYSIDFHDVAEFKLWDGRKCFAVTPTFKTKAMLDFLDFLEENGIKKFHEVTLFGDDGRDRLQVKEYDERGYTLHMDQIRWLVKAIAERDKA